MSSELLKEKVLNALVELGGSPEWIESRGLPVFNDAEQLTVAHVSQSGREHLLTPAAAQAWQAMRSAADLDGATLIMISGFRSFERQHALLAAQVEAGKAIEDVLTVLAPPGCSEHHTGRATDIGTPGCEPLSEEFENTAAFDWLSRRAAEFGFSLSFPRGNPFGYTYEPWHWCYAGPAAISA